VFLAASTDAGRVICLLAVLVQSAWATVGQRGSIFKKRFYRQMQHRGRKRALIAAARSLLEVSGRFCNA
jgi:hypothetical protein